MRMTWLAALAVTVAASSGAAVAETGSPRISVAKTATCGCCTAWIDYMEDNGFEIEAENLPSGALVKHKLDHGIANSSLMSCHTARIDGYTIEGHVPAEDIRRLLEERPEAVGLTVPGMPLGSPGMDQGDDREAYDVLLLRADGETEVFSSYPAD